MFSQKNCSKKVLKRALLVKLLIVNLVIGTLVVSVTQDLWVKALVGIVLAAFVTFVTFYFWLDQPEKEFGPITWSQVTRARFNSRLADLQVRLAEKALFRAWYNLRSGESLW